MSASLCIDTSDLQPGALTIGNVGGGVLAEDIPSGFEHESFLFNDVSLPADNGKEIRGQILTVPSAGNFFAYENGAIVFTDAPDGAYTFSYQLYVDYVAVGSPVTSNINVGAGNYSVARAESLAIAEAAAAIRAASAAAAETLGLADSSSASLSAPGAYLRDAVETLGIADSVSSSAAQSAAQAESVGLAESVSASAATGASQAESFALGDTCNAVLGTAPTTHSAFWTFAVPADRDYRFAVLARDYRYEVH